MESLRLRTKEYPAKWVFRGKRSCGLIETAPRCLCQPVASGANLHSRGWSVGGAWVGVRWKVKGQEVAPNVNNSFRRDAFWHFLIHPIGRNGEASLKRIRRWRQPTAPPGGGNIWRIPEESRRDPRRIPVSFSEGAGRGRDRVDSLLFVGNPRGWFGCRKSRKVAADWWQQVKEEEWKEDEGKRMKGGRKREAQ